MSALLALVLAAARFSARCDDALARANAAPPERLRAILVGLAPPELDGHPGALPSIDAAIDELDPKSPVTAEERSRVLETLRAVCAQAHRADDSAARVDAEALRRVLDQPEFANRRGERWVLGGVIERVWDFFKELLEQRASRNYASVARAVFLVLVALFASFMARLVLRRRGQVDGPRERIDAPRVQREPSASELIAMAESALSRGDLRGAVREQMHATVVALAERGLADRRGASTNREIARALAGTQPSLAPLASELAARFDSAIYGGAPIDTAFASQFARDAASLRTRAGAAG